MSSNAAGSGCTSPGGSCNATPAFGQLSEQLQRLLRALLHQINHAAIFHIRQDGGVAVPLADGLLIRSAHPSGRLWRSISATLRFVKAEESGRLKLTPPQTALHSPAHHPIGRVLHDPGQTGAPRTVRHCWSRAITCASKLRVKRPRGGRPWHVGRQGAPAFEQQARHRCGNNGLLRSAHPCGAACRLAICLRGSNWQISRCRQVRSSQSLISARSLVSGSPQTSPRAIPRGGAPTAIPCRSSRSPPSPEPSIPVIARKIPSD